MINESYLEKPYSLSKSTIATCLACGAALLAPAGLGMEADSMLLPENLPAYACSAKQLGSNIPTRLYSKNIPTWMSADQMSQIELQEDVNLQLDVEESLRTIKKFAFLSVDEKIDREIEQHFASKPMKTRTIFVNKRINRT